MPTDLVLQLYRDGFAGRPAHFHGDRNRFAGNTSGEPAIFSVIIDTSSPAAPVINAIMDDTGASSIDRITNDARLFLAGIAEANSIVELTRVGEGVIGTTLADGNGAWIFDYTQTALPEGTRTASPPAQQTPRGMLVWIPRRLMS